jgi:LacI family transcriptional regulator
MRTAQPTMRDVASAAGVSIKTVSRVVNDEPGVAPGTRLRVQCEVERLHFTPNLAAQELRSTSRRSG